MNLTEEQKLIVDKVLNHPAFSFNTSNNQTFYTNEKKEELYKAIGLLLKQIDSINIDIPIYKKIELVLCKGTAEFPCNFSTIYASEFKESNFPDERLSGRTAYGLLCTDEGANCVGFAEASCILLNLKGYNATPLLVKLLKQNQLVCHYVAALQAEDGLIHIVDAERLRSCSEPEKNWDLLPYQCSIMYASPNEYFCKNKIGPTGMGPKFTDYMKITDVASPINEIIEEIPQIVDELGRLPIVKGQIDYQNSKKMQEILSETIKEKYVESLNLMNENKIERRIA